MPRRSANQISLKWKVILPIVGIVLVAFVGYTWISLTTVVRPRSVVPTQHLLAAAISLTALVAALILVLYVLVNRPIQELAAVMRSVEEGDLDRRVHIHSGDELEHLANTFNRMLDEIQAKNRQLVEAGQQLLQSEKLASIGLLAAGVAHEINNPVATISVSAECLLESEQQPDRRRFLLAISEEADRIGGIVRKLLDFDRGGHDRFSDCNLVGAVDRAMEESRREAERSGVTLASDLQLDGHRVQGQCDQLRQAFASIIDNAIRAMPHGGRLEVRARVHEPWIVLTFTDTGSGIAEEHLDHIFDPFFTTREVGEGFGLGLAVAYAVVRRHGGEISAESGPKGTTFTIKLPDMDARANAA